MIPTETAYRAIFDKMCNSKIQPPWKDKDCLEAIKTILRKRDEFVVDCCIEELKEFGESYRLEEIEALQRLKKRLR